MIPLKLIDQYAQATPNGIALVTTEGNVTWEELRDSVAAKVGHLVTRFPGDLPAQACYLSENGIGLVAWLSALATLGITATGLDATLPDDRLFVQIQTLNPDLVLWSTRLPRRTLVARRVAQASILEFEPDLITEAWESVGSTSVDPSLPFPSWRFRAVSITSGTSGTPKFVVRTESFEARRFEFFTRRCKFSSQDRFLACIPIHHAAGNGWIRLFLSLGATVVLHESRDPVCLATAVVEHRITATVMVPVLLARLVEGWRQLKLGLPTTLQWVLVGGRNFTPSEKRRALETLGCVREYYGTTETGVNTLAEPEDLTTHPDSVGKVFEGNAIQIVDAQGRVVGPDEVGCVAVQSYMNMAHYLDGGSNEIWIEGSRYLLTPDQGLLDREGRLHLRNRTANAENGADLYGLEEAIRQIPLVRDVVVHQPPRTASREIACALVLDGPESIEHNVRSLVLKAGLQLVRYLEVPEIPYSPTGKVGTDFLDESVPA